jgi:hypothetical protein
MFAHVISNNKCINKGFFKQTKMHMNKGRLNLKVVSIKGFALVPKETLKWT